jgi:hypothetical protein
MEKKTRTLRCPEDAIFEFSDKLLKHFSPQEAMFISYRELIEFIEDWISENFDPPENVDSIQSQKSKICHLDSNWLNDL